MIKRLYLVRHAKAESRSLMLRDFNRELTSEGYVDAAKMASFLKKQGVDVQRLVSSSASRTRQTAQVFAEQLDFNWDKSELFSELYDGGLRAYARVIAETPDEVTSLMLVGHNPDITYFAEHLVKDFNQSMSKTAVCIIEFEGISWNAVASGTGKLAGYFTVKSLNS